MPARMLAVLFALAACTSGPVPAPTPPPPSTTTTVSVPTPGEAVAAFAECMGAAGVEVPPPPLDALGHPDLAVAFAGFDTGDEQFRAALAGCAPMLVQSGALVLHDDPELREAILARLQAFAQCMRARGYDVPDPDPDFDGSAAAFPPEDLPFSAVGFDQAAADCHASAVPTG